VFLVCGINYFVTFVKHALDGFYALKLKSWNLIGNETVQIVQNLPVASVVQFLSRSYRSDHIER